MLCGLYMFAGGGLVDIQIKPDITFCYGSFMESDFGQTYANQSGIGTASRNPKNLGVLGADGLDDHPSMMRRLLLFATYG